MRQCQCCSNQARVTLHCVIVPDVKAVWLVTLESSYKTLWFFFLIILTSNVRPPWYPILKGKDTASDSEYLKMVAQLISDLLAPNTKSSFFLLSDRIRTADLFQALFSKRKFSLTNTAYSKECQRSAGFVFLWSDLSAPCLCASHTWEMWRGPLWSPNGVTEDNPALFRDVLN